MPQMRRMLPVLLLFVAGSSMAAEPSPATPAADTGTARVEFHPGDWTKVDLDVHGVRVERILLRPAKGMTGLVTRHQEANRVLMTVLNTTDRTIEPSIAVAAFDAEGHLLAAGNTGLSIKSLKPAAYREVEVHLGGVYRHLSEAAVVYVTLEF